MIKKIMLLAGFLCMASWGHAMKPDDPGEDYMKSVRPIWEKMSSTESEHFMLWTEGRDGILTSQALLALEQAWSRIGSVLGEFPSQKIRVEIYRTQEDFSLASTLSKEILDRSGAIGICKFGRLMILTPEALPFGYRWLDTLAHEYTHYLINEVSNGACPLWLHEGTAKYLETLWRLPDPEYLSPGNRTELVKALKDGRLVTFKRMDPSMVYLKDQAEVSLAFSQVAHALHFVETLKGRNGIRDILKSMGKGKSREDAFVEVLGMNQEAFESNWIKFLESENLEESPGALADRRKIGGSADELENLVSVDVRGHLRLGDRLRMAGKTEAAVLQYEKALAKEPSNPVALVRLARVYIAAGNKPEAVKKLELAVKENPNYVSSLILLAEMRLEEKNFEEARRLYSEAFAVNPFDPRIQEGLNQAAHSPLPTSR